MKAGARSWDSEPLGSGRLRRDAAVVVAASIPFAIAGFGILELPVRWAETSPYSSVVTGIILAAFGLGYGLSQIPSGLLTDRLGAVRTLRLALLGCVVGWPLSLVDAWPIVGLGRFVYGFGIGLTFSAGLMIIRSSVRENRRPQAIAVYGSSWAVGLVFAAFFAESELVSGLVLAAAVVLGYFRLATLHSPAAEPTPERVSPEQPRRSWTGAYWTTGAAVMCLVVPAGLLGQVALVTWAPRTVTGETGISVAAVGLAVAVGLVAGNIIGRSIARLAYTDTIVAASPILTGSLVAVFAFAGGSAALRLAAVTAASTASLINFPPGMARIFRDTPAHLQAGTTALVNQLGWIASALGPILLGLAAAQAEAPSRLAWLAVGCLCAAAGVAALAVNRAGVRT
jgi:MFS family permease